MYPFTSNASVNAMKRSRRLRRRNCAALVTTTFLFGSELLYHISGGVSDKTAMGGTNCRGSTGCAYGKNGVWLGWGGIQHHHGRGSICSTGSIQRAARSSASAKNPRYTYGKNGTPPRGSICSVEKNELWAGRVIAQVAWEKWVLGGRVADREKRGGIGSVIV